MYKLIVDGTCAGMIEKPVWVRHEKDIYRLCNEPEAEGVAYQNVVYQLCGRKRMRGTEPEATLKECNAGELLAQAETALNDLAEMCLDQEYRITTMELGDM